MDIVRFVMMTILGIVKELACGANRQDLADKCCECEDEVRAHDELKKSEG